MSFSPLLNQLIDALRCLPGVGPKSAQRMAFHLLQRDRVRGRLLAERIEQAIAHMKHCERCNTFSEHTLCRLCSDSRRDSSLLCIVENPSDILAIEQTSTFKGLYFVLMGHLSPLDGIGPQDLSMDKLIKLLEQNNIKEVIIATNPTVEGQATAHYLTEISKQRKIKTTRLASGIPLGSELEFIDGGTLAYAFNGRETLYILEEESA